MTEVKEKVKTAEEKELDEKVARFEKAKAQKRSELGSVLSFLTGTVTMK